MALSPSNGGRDTRSASAEEVCVDSGEVKGLSQPFDWIWIASTLKSRRNNGNWSTGYIENLTM
jgi:hypothetical protein